MKNSLIRCLLAVIVPSLFIAVLSWLSIRDLPSSLVPANDYNQRIRIADRSGVLLYNGFGSGFNQTDFVALSEIDPTLKRAVILAEDKRFYQHAGIDWLARLNAIWQNISSLKIVRGASTITEQVIRIINPRPRTIWSRWIEGIEASILEDRFSKDQILEFYLNQIPYGSERRGISQAARLYFDRDLSTLSQTEIVALAILIRAPSKLDSKVSRERLEIAATDLLKKLHAEGLSSELNSLDFANHTLKKSNSIVDKTNLHFVEYIKNRIGSVKQDYFANGVLFTTIDSELQNFISKLLSKRLIDLKGQDLRNAAALVINHNSGEILAWVNANKELDRAPDSYIDAVLTARQPGSTLKPFLYAMALEKGWSAASLIEDQALLQSIGSGIHNFRNYSRTYYGNVRLRDALANSLNTTAIRTIKFVGVANFYSKLKTLGFSTLVKNPDYYGEGLALGNAEVSLYELVRAYTVLARAGVAIDISPILNYKNFQTEPSRIFSTESSEIIRDILSDRIARRYEFGTSGVLNMPGKVALKTGTSTDFKDLWIIGYSGSYTVGIWMGNLDGQATRSLTGSSGPAIVLRAIFHKLYKDDFLARLNIKPNLHTEKICSVSGKIPSLSCPSIEEVFDPNHIVSERCDAQHNGINAFSATQLRAPSVLVPSPGLQVAMDPRIPDDLEVLALQLKDPSQVVKTRWYLDNQLVAETDKKYFSWNLKKGRHFVRAEVQYNGDIFFRASEVVSFLVK